MLPSESIPTPYIQPNLRPRLNRQARMPRLRVSRAIRSQILPKDGISSHGLECYSFLLFIPCALNPAAPIPRGRFSQPRKPRPPTRTVRINVHHETTHAVHLPRALPVVVVRVMPTGTIFLYLQSFEQQSLVGQVWPLTVCLAAICSPAKQSPALGPRPLAAPSLQAPRARLDTFHGVRAREGRDRGAADGGVDELRGAGGDEGGGELVGAGWCGCA